MLTRPLVQKHLLTKYDKPDICQGPGGFSDEQDRPSQHGAHSLTESTDPGEGKELLQVVLSVIKDTNKMLRENTDYFFSSEMLFEECVFEEVSNEG